MDCHSTGFSLLFARDVIIQCDFQVNDCDLDIVIDPSNHSLTNRIGRTETIVINARRAGWGRSRNVRSRRCVVATARRNPEEKFTFVYNNHSHLRNC
ncbi:hypothetical protein B9Z07_17155 [Burkholderia cenocepacia]|uniref:Uncharacterized protein n=1 Tax=Burkholderia cenocepacia TaxID=95486 RepID=A0AAD0J116_9BURK|nr:hypothetical protein B9Z07_17155 [Burkholderia cenocepacia]